VGGRSLHLRGKQKYRLLANRKASQEGQSTAWFPQTPPMSSTMSSFFCVQFLLLTLRNPTNRAITEDQRTKFLFVAVKNDSNFVTRIRVSRSKFDLLLFAILLLGTFFSNVSGNSILSRCGTLSREAAIVSHLSGSGVQIPGVTLRRNPVISNVPQQSRYAEIDREACLNTSVPSGGQSVGHASRHPGIGYISGTLSITPSKIFHFRASLSRS